MNLRNRAVVVGLSVALTLGGVSPLALATPQSELDEAAERLETLGSELSDLQDSLAEKTTALEKTSYKISEKSDQIKGTRAELAEARATLGDRMRSSYKSGGTSLLSVLLGSHSLSELISRIYYMDKVAESDAEAIDAVEALEERLGREREDLQKTKARQQKAVEELQAQVDDYSVKVTEAQEYYDSLDAQIQAEIAAQLEAEENARIQAALEAAEQEKAQEEAESEAEVAAEDEAAEPEAEPEEDADAQDEAADDAGETEQTEKKKRKKKTEEQAEEAPAEEAEQEPASGSAAEGGGLSTAYACIGRPYAYGAAGPDSFDCSGLVCYCYGWSRGRTTYAMISSLKADGVWKTKMSQLNVGDLIFTHEGHVGIYVGGGEMVHAPSPGRSVCQAPVYAFIGGGPF